MIERTGLATAVAELGGVGDLGLDDGGDQVDMFEPDMPLPMPAATRGKSGPKGGRPVGAKNKSTEQIRQYLLSRYRSPLVGLLEMYSRTPKQLAEELELYVIHEGAVVVGMDGKPMLATGEAFKRQVEAMVAALPYMHQKLPIAIEQTGKNAGMIVIGDIAGVQNAGDGTITVTFDRPEGNQQVIEGEAMKSDE